MFDNAKCNYAMINFGGKIIKGYCEHWEMPGYNGWIKLVINGKQYITHLTNVLMTEIGKSNEN